MFQNKNSESSSLGLTQGPVTMMPTTIYFTWTMMQQCLLCRDRVLYLCNSLLRVSSSHQCRSISLPATSDGQS